MLGPDAIPDSNPSDGDMSRWPPEYFPFAPICFLGCGAVRVIHPKESLLQLYSHMNAWAKLDILGQPNTLLTLGEVTATGTDKSPTIGGTTPCVPNKVGVPSV